MSRSATPALSFSSSTTTLIALPPSRENLVLAPPPTKNTLQPLERARLMRSTKKIGALLGTTPHFADYPVSPYPSYPYSHSRSSSSSISLLPIGQSAQLRVEEERERLREKRQRRQGSIFEVVSSDLGSFEVVPLDLPRRSVDSLSSTSTASSVQSKGKGRSKPKHQPQPLVLCLETRPVEVHQEEIVSLPCTPTTATILGDSIKIATPLPSTTSHLPVTPLSPMSSNSTPTLRSRRPSTHHSSRFATFASGSPITFAPVLTPNTPLPARPHYTKSSSAPITPTSLKPPSPGTQQERRKKLAKLTKQFGENVPPELVFRESAPKPEPRRREERTQRRRSMSVDYALTVNTVDAASGQVVGMGVAFSSGESWVGEWNRDMKDVQKGLRALKLR